MRALIAVTMLTLAFGASGQSQPPSPAPSKATNQPKSKASNNQTNPDSDKRATRDQPAIVELLKALAIQIETTEKTEKREDYSSHEWWLVYITGALAVITLGLTCFTGKLWAATKRLVIDSIASAKAIERAYIFAEPVMQDSQLIGGTQPLKNEFVIRFNNHGKTPAEIRRIKSYAFVQSSVPQELEGSMIELGQGLGIAQKDTYVQPITAMLTTNDVVGIFGLYHNLYIVGEMLYEDIFGDRHETGFCWQVIVTGPADQRKYELVPTRESRLNKRT